MAASTNEVVVVKFPDDLGIFGSFEVRTKWNGEETMNIRPDRIEYKGVNIVPSSVLITMSGFEEFPRLKFSVYVPHQTSEWSEGMVGLTESFDIQFENGGSTFKGVFQRTNEGSLSTEGERQETPEERAERLPVLVRQASSGDDCCPICFEEWITKGQICVQTECGHRFCMRCVVSCCALTPPAETGKCPLCRGTVTLNGISRVSFGT